ncbi:MAG TPA: L,D-transpeptidase [Longimicrobiaceae bacterium]|jgi:L,D-transpeptidase YbiS|nr:L,D-transpeptidase [Longimicrobiaceae bacterium]
MKHSIRRLLSTAAPLAAALALAFAPHRAAAQGLPVEPLSLEHGGDAEGSAVYRDPPVDVEGRYIVISLEQHQLYLMEHDRVIWQTLVGTGTGTRLEGAGQKWEFSTPRGMFRVQRKEKDPRWYVPDWSFVERKLPIPPPDSPKRWETGMLGTSALYLGEGIAVHGTSKPELLGQNVSHGCIRMTNEAARQLYHDVEVGTPVFIY